MNFLVCIIRPVSWE